MSISKLVHFVLILLLVCQSAKAQEEQAEWMLQDLLSDSDPVQSITLNQEFYTKPFFWPEDLKVPGKEIARFDYIIKNKNGLFLIIEGTGRVYKIVKSKEGIDFIRQDSTFYFGYNFAPINFSYKDTLYSLGGYGYWRTNGHLRYYKDSGYGWEIKVLNQEVPIQKHRTDFIKPGLWIDFANGILFYLEAKFSNEAIRMESTNNYYSESLQLWTLDISKGIWKNSNKLSNQAFSVIDNSEKLCDLPWGELIRVGRKPQNELYLIDYSANEIFLLNKNLASKFLNVYHPEKDGFNQRTMLYYKDSILHLLTSSRLYLKLPLKKSDFQSTGIELYSSAGFSSPMYLLLSIVVLSFVGGIGYLLYAKGKRKNTEKSAVTVKLFTKSELELIQTIAARSDFSMTTEDVNFILGTTKKSVDVQKKHRSDIIKSINEKYKSFTNITELESFIEKKRIENDKRVLKYYIHPEKYKRLNDLITLSQKKLNGDGDKV